MRRARFNSLFCSSIVWAIAGKSCKDYLKCLYKYTQGGLFLDWAKQFLLKPAAQIPKERRHLLNDGDSPQRYDETSESDSNEPPSILKSSFLPA